MIEEAVAAPIVQAPSPLPEEDLTAAQQKILLLAYRWTVMVGRPPAPGDWAEAGWPSEKEVVAAGFHCFDCMLDLSQIDDAAYVESMWTLEEESDSLGAREKAADKKRREAESLRRQLEEEAERRRAQVANLERRAKRAAEQLAEARGEARDWQRRAERAERDLERALARAASADAPAAPAAPEEGAHAGEGEDVPAEWLAEHERALETLAKAEREVDGLHRRIAELEAGLRQKDTAVAQLSAEVGKRQNGAGEAEAEQAPQESAAEPRTVAEAVAIAQESCEHLRFARRAHESAAESPYVRPAQVLDALLRLDRVAEQYLRPEGIGKPIVQVAKREGLDWRGGVSLTARTRYGDDYRFTYGGKLLELGPHVGFGRGGPNSVLRIYLCLHEGDGELERSVIVGHVGRHLSDTTT